MALNTLWEKVEKISSEIIWWNLFLLWSGRSSFGEFHAIQDTSLNDVVTGSI